MTHKPLSDSEIFRAAAKLNPDQRPAYLDEACGDNRTLRDEVESLLRAHDPDGSFLESPAVAPTINQPMSERPGSIIGPYKLREQIGEGGFGVVYVAEQEHPIRRKVALKVIKPGMDSKDVIARFDAERQALAMMDHPNVAKVLDAGATEQGRLYFVMELVQGITITEFCNRNRTPTLQRLLLLADVARAVHHAHQKGIIHRDIKPSNVMVTLHDGKPVVKVIDFGISKALNQRISEHSVYTAYGQMIGTPSYMSPEQAELSGLGVDTRSDIYSLGVLAYELLTGETPLDAKRLRESAYAEILRIIREEEPPRPSLKVSTLVEKASALAQQQQTEPDQLRRELAGDIDWIVMKCLEKDRSRRYESANALVRDIERYVNNEPIDARPPSLGYQLSKFGRKHRTLIATTMAFVLLLVGATGLSTWLALRARNLSRIAQREVLNAQESLREETRQREIALISQAAAEAAQQRLRKLLYASTMNLIQTAADRQQYSHVRSLLDSLIPNPRETDLRRFEWYYWHRYLQASTPETRQLTSPQGRTLLRCGPYGVRAFYATIEMPETDLSGTPLTKDGSELHKVVISAVDLSEGRVIREWKITHFQEPYGAVSIGGGSLWPFDNIEISRDGTRMAVYFETKEASRVELYDTDAADPIMDLTLQDSVSGVNLTPDGNRMLVMSYPGSEDDESGSAKGITYNVWDTKNRELVYELAEPDRRWTSRTAVLSADGRKLSRTLRLPGDGADDRRGEWLFELIDIESGTTSWTQRLTDVNLHYHSWSPDNRWIALRLSDQSKMQSQGLICLFDSETAEQHAMLSSDISIREIIFSPNSQRIASFAESSIDVWDIPTISSQYGGKQTSTSISPLLSVVHQGTPLLAVQFSSDSAQLVGVTGGTSLRWKLSGVAAGQKFLPASDSHCSMSMDAGRLALTHDDGRISIWNPRTQQRVCQLEQESDRWPEAYQAFSADNRRIMTLERVDDGSRTIAVTAQPYVYDGETGKLIRRFNVTASAFNPNAADLSFSGDQIAVIAGQSIRADFLGGDQSTAAKPELQLWDVASGMLIQSRPLVAPENQNRRFAVLYVRDGSEIAVFEVVSINCCLVHFYDASTLSLKRTIECSTAHLKFERNRESICERHENGDLVVRNPLSGEIELRLATASSHAGPCARTHDGSRIATVSRADSGNQFSVGRRAMELTIWDTQTGDRLFSKPLAHDFGVLTQIAFTKDDSQLVIASPSVPAVKLTILDATPVD